MKPIYWFFILAALLGMVSVPDARASEERQQLVIVTSFPDSVYLPFKKAFEATHQNVELRVINRKTSAAISYIQDGASPQADLFWASAPDAFEVLKSDGRLGKLPKDLKPQPSDIRGYPLHDPDGYYAGFAISGYGLMWNMDYLSSRKLTVPDDWEDLKRSVYQNHLGITAPSRSGTTHLIVEILLQGKGWDEGWRTLVEIGGNLATVTARSYGVPHGVERGHFGIGLVIDFFGLRSKASGRMVEFRYPAGTAFLPANIALVRGARNTQAAKLFISYLLSDDGQKLLFRPDISRLPVRRTVYQTAPEGFPNPFALPVSGAGLLFDIQLSRQRYHLVNALFDQLITFRLRELKEAWSLVHKAEARIDTDKQPELAAEILKARRLLEKMPVSEQQSRNAEYASVFSRHKPGFTVSNMQSKLETDWKIGAIKRYDEAAQIAELVLERLGYGKKLIRQP